MRIPFVGPCFTSHSPLIDPSRTINFYLEQGVSTSRSPMSLVGSPGTELFSVVGKGPIRGAHYGLDKLLVVSGNEVYTVNEMGTGTLIGTISTSAGPVSITNNGKAVSGIGGDQIIVVDGQFGYTSDGTTVSIISDADFVDGASSVTFIDGYFVANRPNNMAFGVCDLYDGTKWDALATATANANPDVIKVCANVNQQLWLIKDTSSEIWYNAGIATSTGSPFLRISGGVIGWGTAAPASFSMGDNGFFMLAKQRNSGGGAIVGVVKVDGYVPSIISPPSINYMIGKMSKVDDAIGYCYSDDGHMFYVITFPSGNATFVYDASLTSLHPYERWHERSKWVKGSIGPNRHHGNCYVNAFGKHLIGDYASGSIYELNDEVYTDNGDPIVSVRQSPALFRQADGKRIHIHRLTLEVETGVGNEDVTNPSAILDWSNDNGKTWSNGYAASIGKVGEYGKRVKWDRIGEARGKVFRITMSDPTKKVITGAMVE